MRYVPDAPTLVAMGFDPPVEEKSTLALDFGSLPLGELRSSRTGPEGEFEIKAWRLPGRPGDAFDPNHWTEAGLLIMREGYAARMLFHSFAEPPSHDFGDIILSPETRVAGVVSDAEGRPLARVELRLEAYIGWDPQRRSSTGGRVYRIDGLDRTETDEHGRFELAGLDSGALFFTLRREDRARRTVRAIARGDLVDLGRIVLPAAGAISGSVVDVRGDPVSGADVWLADASFDWERSPGFVGGPPRYSEGDDWAQDQIRALTEESAPHARTDDSGRFTVRGRGSPTYDLYVYVPGYEVVRIEDVEVGRGDLRLSLGADAPRFRPERTLAVVLVDQATGEKIRGGKLTALRLVDRESVEDQGEIHAWPRVATELPISESSDGALVVRGLGPVATYLQAEAPGYASTRTTLTQLPDSPFRLALERGSSVSGVVLDATGKPVVGAGVYVIPTRSYFWPAPGELAARTDEHGAFRVDGLPGDAVVLSARAEGVGTSDRVRLEFGKTARDESVRLTLLAFGSVEGVAVRQDGSIEPHAWVDLESIVQGEGWRRHPSQETRADDQGKFVFTEVPPGRHRVRVGWDRWGPTGEVLAEAGQPSVVDVAPTEHARITGRVESDGEAVAWAHLEGRKEDDAIAFFLSWTREDGRYVAVAETPGTYTVRVETPQGGRSAPERVTVGRGAVAMVDFTLPTGSVQGRLVSSEEGSPIGGALVGLVGQEEEVLARDFTSARGEFRFAQLSDGAYVLRVWPRLLGAEDQGSGFLAGEWPVEVREGAITTRRLEVPRGLSIAGTVRTRSGILARDGTEVNLVRTDSEDPLDFPSDGYSAITYTWGGGYRVSGLEPGSYRLLPEAESPQEARDRGTRAELREMDVDALDLTLRGAGPRPPRPNR